MRVFAILALMSMAGAAQAHQLGCDGKPVPAQIKSSCCGAADAHQLDPSQVRQDDAGKWHVYLPDQEVVLPDDKAEPSPDGCYRIFFNPAYSPALRIFYCFFVPIGI